MGCYNSKHRQLYENAPSPIFLIVIMLLQTCGELFIKQIFLYWDLFLLKKNERMQYLLSWKKICHSQHLIHYTAIFEHSNLLSFSPPQCVPFSQFLKYPVLNCEEI